MAQGFRIDGRYIGLRDIRNFVFARTASFSAIELTPECEARIQASHTHLSALVDKGTPIYGVTTGFGDSCFRAVAPSQSEELQKNLIQYLRCGTGPKLSRYAAKATCLIRLVSLSRGYSGISLQLISRMKMLLERDWIPIIPREGSLGASGDLVPLAYLAQVLQGEGEVETKEGVRSIQELFDVEGISPYRLKPKEGLALVNGTSAMAGLALVNLELARQLLELSVLSSSWLCIALCGQTDPFGVLVNEQAKSHRGQKIIAKWIRTFLEEEDYHSPLLPGTGNVEGILQDRYSLRCAPQILGPVLDTLSLFEQWLEQEVNSTSDNPLVDPDGNLAMGGNFYGGYLSQGMDYMKISLGHIADMIDRHLAMIIDEKSNRGLPPNLADWNSLPESERFLHHGLKGLHQAVSAITSEVLAKTIPNGIFSRSSECHNQDKVSLGMSAAVQCSEVIEALYTIQTMHLICLAQALDLRKHEVKGDYAKRVYGMIRQNVPFIKRDVALDTEIRSLAQILKQMGIEKGAVLHEEA